MRVVARRPCSSRRAAAIYRIVACPWSGRARPFAFRDTVGPSAEVVVLALETRQPSSERLVLLPEASCLVFPAFFRCSRIVELQVQPFHRLLMVVKVVL